MSKHVLIDRIQVTLTPEIYHGGMNPTLRLSVRSLGQEYLIEQTLPPDDIESFFDRCFDLTKERLKAEIRKQCEVQGFHGMTAEEEDKARAAGAKL